MPPNLNEIYSHYSFIEKELLRRRTDPVLKQKVQTLFEGKELFPISEGPFGMISRSIATPNKELQYFHDLVEGMGLSPVVLEYDGKFVAKNLEKYFLCRLHFCDTPIQKEAQVHHIVDFNEWEGEYLSKIITKKGVSLQQTHRKLLSSSVYNSKTKIIDITDWFNEVRRLEEGYYFYFLSLFIFHGVLFENYLLTDKEEYAFFEEKILPSLKRVEEYFGVKPLIYPLLPITHENRKEWLYYPEFLKGVI